VHFLCTALLLQERGFHRAAEFTGQKPGVSQRRKTSFSSVETSPHPLVFCDFHPFKSLVGAEYLLSSHEQRELMRSLYGLLCVPEPDLVVYLRAVPDVVVSRLRQQNEVADGDALAVERACLAFEAFFRRYKGEKVDLDTTSLDDINDAPALASLLREVPLLSGRSSVEALPPGET
jgi:deoxyadenosine/deoxycytidine kinase